jgi:Zn finger protein HypA/HybF involved in hydrogenase expression
VSDSIINDEIKTRCLKCNEEAVVSLYESFFVCRHCRSRNNFDDIEDENFKLQRKGLLKIVLSNKPNKPENN